MLDLYHPQVFFPVIVNELLILGNLLSPQLKLFLLKPHLLVTRSKDLLFDQCRPLQLIIYLLNILFHVLHLLSMQLFNLLLLFLLLGLFDLFLFLDLLFTITVKLLHSFLFGYHVLNLLELFGFVVGLIAGDGPARELD